MTVFRTLYLRPEDILPRSGGHLDTRVNSVGMLEYLSSWVLREEGVMETTFGCIFDKASLPLLLDAQGEPQALSCSAAGERIFQDEEQAYGYIVGLASKDLEYRGFRDDRVATFQRKQDASMLLQRRVRNCRGDAEYFMLRTQWDSVNRLQHWRRTWSPRQEEVLGGVAYAASLDDEEQKRQRQRCLFLSSGLGSGKSAVLMQLAVRLRF